MEEAEFVRCYHGLIAHYQLSPEASKRQLARIMLQLQTGHRLDTG